jgi:UDP-N-acetyl-D-mannosaminuronic acid dehydrogenase
LPPVLLLKPEDFDSPQKRSQFTVCIVGCGVSGVCLGLAFADAGFKVIFEDADQSVVKTVLKAAVPFLDRQLEAKLKGYIRKELLNATNDLKAAVLTSNIIIITLNPKFEKKTVQNAEIKTACKQIGGALSRGSLVVYTGVGGLGFVEGLVKETLENTSGLTAGEGFGLAYHSKPVGEETVVAADDKFSLNVAAGILQSINSKPIKKVSDVRLAEAATLFSAMQQDVNLALANELAIFCESAHVDYIETLKLIGDASCQASLAPSVSEKSSKNEVCLLLENAESLNVKLRLPTLARQINEDMARHAFNLAQDALRVGGGTLRRAGVALLNSDELDSSSDMLVELLKTKGAKVTRYSPHLALSDVGVHKESGEETFTKKTLNEAVEGTDCLIIISGQDLGRLNLKKMRALMKSQAALVDLAGVVEPQKAEAEGFIYRGLGRGLTKK